ncbi:PH domain-containing protein [Belliella buryatensis]|uniref:PH domain-containing protein n=2 Tax=Belliella buryatensis TaxID=1500549 RepID=A0A239FX84_9BACT|nr:PH domain-containing protein [Belliella buryatensis]
MKNVTFNLNLKQRLVFAITSGVVYSFSLFLIDLIFGGEVKSAEELVFMGIFFGGVFGVGFPILMEWIGAPMFEKLVDSITPSLEIDEKIEYVQAANLFRGIEGVGGQVFLTNKKLIFKGHKFNIQKGQKDFPYEDILSCIARKTGGLIDNGVRLQTKGGEQHDFVVHEREVFLGMLREKIDNSMS